MNKRQWFDSKAPLAATRAVAITALILSSPFWALAWALSLPSMAYAGIYLAWVSIAAAIVRSRHEEIIDELWRRHRDNPKLDRKYRKWKERQERK